MKASAIVTACVMGLVAIVLMWQCPTPQPNTLEVGRFQMIATPHVNQDVIYVLDTATGEMFARTGAQPEWRTIRTPKPMPNLRHVRYAPPPPDDARFISFTDEERRITLRAYRRWKQSLDADAYANKSNPDRKSVV